MKTAKQPARRRPGETVTTLYAKFEKAEAVMKTVPSTAEKAFSAAVDKPCRIARRIATSPATSIEEMLLKLRIAAWETGARYKRLDELDHWKPRPSDGTEHYILASLQEDLRLMRGQAFIDAQPRRR